MLGRRHPETEVNPSHQIALVINFVGGLALYLYLQRIGWPDLLHASIISTKGLGLVVVILLLTIAAIVVVFYGATYVLFFLVNLYSDRTRMPPWLSPYIAYTHIAWLMILAVCLQGVLWLDNPTPSWWMWVFMGPANNLDWIMAGFMGVSVVMYVGLQKRGESRR